VNTYCNEEILNSESIFSPSALKLIARNREKSSLKKSPKKKSKKFRKLKFEVTGQEVKFKANQTIFKIDAQNCTFIIQCNSSIVVCEGKTNLLSTSIKDLNMIEDGQLEPFIAGIQPDMKNLIHGFRMRHVSNISNFKSKIKEIIKNEKVKQ